MGGDTNRAGMATSSYPQLVKGPVGKQIEPLYRDRLNQFTSGGQYQGQNLLSYVSFLNVLYYS